MSRRRHGRQIKLYGKAGLEDAITNCAARNGLSWFTDEQIADIRGVMIGDEWEARNWIRELDRRRAA